MTEYSWLWDGIVTGDAVLSPYAREAFNRWFMTPRTNEDQSRVYALPNYLDDLLVEASEDQAVSTVTVKAGAAVIDNFIYVSTEDKYFPIIELSLASYRYDSIILRVSRGSVPKVSLVLVNGAESTTYPPTPYTPVQETDGTWEVEVARVLIDSAVYVLDGTKLEVYTHFLPVPSHIEASPYNYHVNSELLAISGESAAGGAVEGWSVYEGAVTPTAATVLTPQSRGQAVNITPTAAIGYQTVKELNGKEYPRITIEGVLKHNDSTTRTKLQLYYLQEYSILSMIKQSDVFGFNTEDTHHFKRTFSVPSDTKYIVLVLTGTAATNDFDIGQIIITPGYYTGAHRPVHEYIGLRETLQDASWDGDAKSSGTTTINLSASFGGILPQHIKGVVLEVRCRDSASAAGAGLGISILSYTSAFTYGSVIVDGVPNNYWRTGQIIAYINEPFQQSLSANRGFRVTVVASGAGTLDAYIEIVGIIV